MWEDVKRKSPLQEGIFINTMTTAVTRRDTENAILFTNWDRLYPYYFAAT
ncbi:MAG: hypothetical protein M5U34_37870 [Chloroflexi bacterium]|nr:hypothetical protein [Chloroflexota bacterium]